MGFPRARWVCRRRNSGPRDWHTPGRPPAWQAPRQLAPQPGRHLGNWPRRLAISRAGTSETGPQARRAPRGLAPQPGGHLGDWPPRAAVSRAGISGCR